MGDESIVSTEKPERVFCTNTRNFENNSKISWQIARVSLMIASGDHTKNAYKLARCLSIRSRLWNGFQQRGADAQAARQFKWYGRQDIGIQ
ncbi:hypothetical protein Ddc_13934 [Ditylenchus destructor]|nr:hypothetical protein Ddc_13934 [Ditylenchus destructor]